MLNKEQVIEIIRMNQKPLWELYLAQSMGSDVKIAFFDGATLKESDSDDKKIEQSIATLLKVLSLYENMPDQRFAIKIKAAKTSNQDGIIGPIYFKINNVESNTINGLSGFPDPIKMGYIPAEVVNQKIEALSGIFESKIQSLIEKQKVENEWLRLKQKEEQLKKDEEKFNSDTEKLGAAGLKVLGKVFDLWLGDDNPLKSSELGKTDKLVDENGKELTAEEKARYDEIEQLAGYLFEEIKDKETLQALSKTIKAMVEQAKQQQKEGGQQ